MEIPFFFLLLGCSLRISQALCFPPWFLDSMNNCASDCSWVLSHLWLSSMLWPRQLFQTVGWQPSHNSIFVDEKKIENIRFHSWGKVRQFVKFLFELEIYRFMCVRDCATNVFLTVGQRNWKDTDLDFFPLLTSKRSGLACFDLTSFGCGLDVTCSGRWSLIISPPLAPWAWVRSPWCPSPASSLPVWLTHYLSDVPRSSKLICPLRPHRRLGTAGRSVVGRRGGWRRGRRKGTGSLSVLPPCSFHIP